MCIASSLSHPLAAPGSSHVLFCFESHALSLRASYTFQYYNQLLYQLLLVLTITINYYYIYVNTLARDSLTRLLATRRHLLVDYTTTELHKSINYYSIFYDEQACTHLPTTPSCDFSQPDAMVVTSSKGGDILLHSRE